MKLFRILLFPVMPIYYLVTWFRNKLFDFGVYQSQKYDFPVICVGNLSTGGTGKSPMIEYLINLLKPDYKVATLSRGYKRETKGFKLAESTDNAKTLGDEPFQFYNKFKESIYVSVDSNRQNGIKNLRALSNKPDIILLDDAFQHRRVSAGLNVLLTTYNNLYCDDWVLPTGNLREPRQGARRAQIIVVTKCPNTLTDRQKNKIIDKINPRENQTLFFSAIKYSDIVISESKEQKLLACNNFTLVTGIANPKPLLDFLNDKELNYDHLSFPDHYVFTTDDIINLEKKELIITTEKDYMRLMVHDSLKDKLYYLPIEVAIQDSEKFDSLITSFVANSN